jgi:hypothetical protein
MRCPVRDSKGELPEDACRASRRRRRFVCHNSVIGASFVGIECTAWSRGRIWLFSGRLYPMGGGNWGKGTQEHSGRTPWRRNLQPPRVCFSTAWRGCISASNKLACWNVVGVSFYFALCLLQSIIQSIYLVSYKRSFFNVLRCGRTRRFQLLNITLSRGHGFLVRRNVQWRSSYLCSGVRVTCAVACELHRIELQWRASYLELKLCNDKTSDLHSGVRVT